MDLAAVVRELRLDQTAACETLVLHGISFGSLAALVAADELAGESVDAVVLDSPIPSFANSSENFARVAGLPLASLTRWRLRWLGWRLGVDYTGPSTRDLLERRSVPSLAIVPTRDVLLGPAREEFINALRPHVTRLWEPDTEHNLAVADDPDSYAEQLAWLDTLVRERGNAG